MIVYAVDNERLGRLKDEVAFVAIKNGQHNGIGYFIDTGVKGGELPEQFPLKDIPSRVCGALGVESDPSAHAATE